MGIFKNFLAVLDWHTTPAQSAYTLVYMMACEKLGLLIVRLYDACYYQ